MTDYDKLRLEKLNYQSYLEVDSLLKLQKPISEPLHHDEMFFIIIHQAAELWFKEVLHEMDLISKAIEQRTVSRVLKTLNRVVAILELQIEQIKLLATLTPVEFAGFRDKLRPASGFQSAQFRKIEFRLGVREKFFLKFFEPQPAIKKELENILQQPSLYDEVLKLLNAEGIAIPQTVLRTTFDQEWIESPELAQVLANAYQDPQTPYHFTLLFEKLIDLDQALSLWRSTHMQMISRTIGQKKGTGGSAGYDFLNSRMHLRCFPELWTVRNLIGSNPYGS